MLIKILKSNELELNLWESITLEFNIAFERNKTKADFIDYYHNTILGYSYHAIAFKWWFLK